MADIAILNEMGFFVAYMVRHGRAQGLPLPIFVFSHFKTAIFSLLARINNDEHGYIIFTALHVPLYKF